MNFTSTENKPTNEGSYLLRCYTEDSNIEEDEREFFEVGWWDNELQSFNVLMDSIPFMPDYIITGYLSIESILKK